MSIITRCLCVVIMLASVIYAEPSETSLNLQQARFGHAAVLVKKQIYILGGTTDKEITGTIEKITSKRDRVESVEANITPRYWLGSATDGKTIYLAGGMGTAGLTPIFESWQPGDKAPRHLSPMPEARSRFDLVYIKGKLYAAGGTAAKGIRSSRLDVYDIATDTWSRGADLPAAREGCAALLNGRIVLAGGYDGRFSQSKVFIYDPVRNTWTESAPLELPQSAHRIVTVGGTLYGFGHYNAMERVTARDPSTGNWSILDLPFFPVRHSHAVFDGKEVFVIGGSTGPSGAAVDRVQRFPKAALAAANRRQPAEAEWASARISDGVPMRAETLEVLKLWGDALAELRSVSLQRSIVTSAGDLPESSPFIQEIDWAPERLCLSLQNMKIVYDGTTVRANLEKAKAALEAPVKNLAAALNTANVNTWLLDYDGVALCKGNPRGSLATLLPRGDWRRLPDETINNKACWILSLKSEANTQKIAETLKIDQNTGVIVSHVVSETIAEADAKEVNYTEERTLLKLDVTTPPSQEMFQWRPPDTLRRISSLSELKPAKQPDTLVGQPAPDLDFTLLDGTPFKLSDQRGKVVLIDFWATWCGPCLRAMPAIQQLHEKLRDRGVVVVGLSTEDASKEKAIRSKIEEMKITYPVAFGASAVADAYGVKGIPNLVLVGPDGIVRDRHIGFSPDLENQLSAKIEKLLSPAPAKP